ncbi:MAG: hypothetical protein GF331_06250 [Chitinivibrionales bacterium]|nr:hypothetical protein [Chitinivibrionales bacterium]
MAEHHIYKVIEVTGTSTESTDDAIRTAVRRASETVRHMSWFEVVESRGKVTEHDVSEWQVTLKIGFDVE